MDSDLQKLRLDKSQKAPKTGGKSWPWIFVILLLAGAGIGYLQWRKASDPVAVEVLHIRAPGSEPQNSDAVLLTATGYIMAAHRIELASKVIGRVAWVGVEMGDKVKKDSVLVRLEDDEYKARVVQEQGQLDAAKARLAELKAGSRTQEIAQAAANVQAAQVDLDKAQRNFKHLSDLRNTAAFSQTELDDADSAAQSAAARLESIRQQYELLKAGSRQEQIAAQQAVVQQLDGTLSMAALDLAKTQLSYATVYAPLTGVVLSKNIEPGEYVAPGTAVVTIGDTKHVWLRAYIQEQDLEPVKHAKRVWVTTDSFTKKTHDGYPGRVSFISEQAEFTPKNVQTQKERVKLVYRIKIDIDNPDEELKPGMPADALIETE